MHVIGAPKADRLVAATGIGTARRLLDVGGGPATYTMAFLRAEPALAAALFDLPPVIEIARDRLTKASLAGRVTLVAGDFGKDELPGGHDLSWLSAVIHQKSPAQNEELFERIYRALVPGGRLVLRDHVMDPDRTHPRAGALFAVNMLVGTSGGGTYSFDEIRSGLARAGFTRIQLIQLIQSGERMDTLVKAFRPA